MRKILFVFALSIALFTGCEKEETNGSELASQVLLSVGIDGDTDMLIDGLKQALIDDVDVTDDEIAGLIWMREEEKLAADLYTSFYDEFGLRIFGNISNSEHTHMTAVLVLLDAFEIDDPASDELGVFSNADLQEAYTNLKESGDVSLVEALKVGAYVEEMDILDLEEQLEEVENENIRLVYENLLRGSRNHLRAFTRVLAQNDVIYSPQLLTEEYYSDVISGEMERGNSGNCALGYGYANQSGNGNRAHFNSQNAECSGDGGGKQYRGGR
ncbi:DUF2202 domain-containing protein [Sunxiuqinia sp. A32]|uniref:DUF2202 domain-containing protein n=1 Tax=Sunxiuqinia sp. A32 TaxID=3461496 RepID=UPI0040451C7B